MHVVHVACFDTRAIYSRARGRRRCPSARGAEDRAAWLLGVQGVRWLQMLCVLNLCGAQAAHVLLHLLEV